MIRKNRFRPILNRSINLLVVISLAIAPSFAQQNGNGRSGSLAALQSSIAATLDQPKFSSARWGAMVLAVNGRDPAQVIFERDGDKSFTPASNMKLYTSAAALDAFGPDFRIRTSVYAARKAGRDGVLRGDLIFYGRGDPNLSPRFDTEDPARYNEFKAAETITAIEMLADQIEASGVRIIAGNLIGDDSYFAGDLLGPGWEWDDAQFYYGAEISALTVNDNCVTFTVSPARRAGEKPAIEILPRNRYAQIVNNALTVERGATRIGVHRAPDSNTVEFFGTIARGARDFEIEIAVHDPAQFAATLLKEALGRRGIRLRGRIQRMDAVARLAKPLDLSSLVEIASVESQPMSEMLKVINKQSQNLHTELMLRQLGSQPVSSAEPDEYGRPRSTASRGNEARMQFLQRAGIWQQGLSLRDGSGLARQNLVTPGSTARLLEFMLAHPHYKSWREALVVAGVDGTLERRMRDTAASNNFRGKTGTLTYVNALSGYVTTRSGQTLVFSLMGNNYTGASRDVVAVLDRICVMLAEYDGGI